MIWSMPCGAFTVYAIEDGWFFRDPLQHFPGSDHAAWATELEEDGRLRISIGCYLVTDGDRATVIDTGIGLLANAIAGGEAVGGQLDQALALVGVRPEEVRLVVHTHLHLDHCGGNLTGDAEPHFPNAVHRAHHAEIDFWLETGEHPAADRVRAMTRPLLDEGRLEAVSGDSELSPGIAVVEAIGHTPGHVAVSVGSLGTRILIIGDLAHHPLQVEHPEWNSAPDLDPHAAQATRDRIFEQVAGTGTVVAASHFPLPGMGYIEKVGTRRMFVTGTAVQIA